MASEKALPSAIFGVTAELSKLKKGFQKNDFLNVFFFFYFINYLLIIQAAAQGASKTKENLVLLMSYYMKNISLPIVQCWNINKK